MHFLGSRRIFSGASDCANLKFISSLQLHDKLMMEEANKLIFMLATLPRFAIKSKRVCTEIPINNIQYQLTA